MNRHCSAPLSLALIRSLRRLPLLRVVSLLLAFCCFWSFAGAGAAMAAAPDRSGSISKPQRSRFSHVPLFTAVPSPFSKSASVQSFSAPSLASSQSASVLRTLPSFAPSPTLLDEVGHLAHPVAATEPAAWSRELAAHPTQSRAALLHVWLGEWQLAANEQPETARKHFHDARTLLAHTDRLYGLASYDTAIAAFKAGAYAEANEDFSRLLAPKTALNGYSRKRCALWGRHAAVCDGYHATRSARGIPEPPRLDPLCGAAALAASLRALHLPSDRNTVLSACRVTGEGSSFQDIRNAGSKLGVSFDAVTADDQGLMALPKPLIAHVEHDHFVSVVRADTRGVSYLCSDCGPWPGGRVDLTWAQWHLLEPDVYGAVCLKGSMWDKTLLALGTTPGAKTLGVQVASVGHLPSLGTSLKLSVRLSKLGKHVVRWDWQDYLPECTVRWDALKCADCLICCLFDALGGGNRYGDGSLGFGGMGGFGGGFVGGASGGDPVNLATGEEEYRPAPDLTVYNPVGPSVQWTRLYDSLRGEGIQTYETEDYGGEGWSQGYNVGVRNPDAVASSPFPHIVAGTTGAVIPYAKPTSGATPTAWTITQNNTTIASNTNPQSWNVTYTPNNQWGTFTVTVPAGAAPGLYDWSSTNSTNFYSGNEFVVQPSRPTAGTKSVYLDNGGTVTFTAPSVPAAGTPRIACTPQAGAPFLVEWDYDSGSAWGHFVITWKDRTKWVTTSADGQSQFILHEIIDRNGNAINFNYSAPLMTSGNATELGPVTYAYDNFPLLSSITNSAGTALLTISRDGNGAVNSVSDCYGRSVKYSLALEGDYRFRPTLTNVSQIIPTASLSASNIPDHYALGYTGYEDDQGYYDPVLHTITTPSPSGPTPATASLSVGETGTGTATINYSDGGAGAVSSLQDANGNTRTYTPCDASGNPTQNGTLTNYTKVVVADKNGNVAYSYIGGVDMNMSGASITDGAGHSLMSKVFSDTHDPYRPSSVTDGNGKTGLMTWDSYANMTSMTPPSSGVRTPAATTYTYNYSTFALGELTQVQTGGKSPTAYAYFEPSGLTKTITAPLPGTVGSASTAVTSFTYDGLGNPLTVTRPGNNTSSAITTTLNYTTDGSYSQTDAIGQPVTVTDNLGKITHLRYDAQGNTVGVKDALGNETDMTYTITNMPLQTALPPTGQTGTGHAGSLTSYLFAEPSSLATAQWPAATLQYGPAATMTSYDEGNVGAIRQTVNTYGPEGELLTVSGSTEPVQYTYDAEYRLKTLQDAALNTTSYFYNTAGYLQQVVYPGAQATPPTAPLTAGTKDTVSFPSYDGVGNLTTRTDGNNVTTTYAYTDPESRLTDITYPAGSIGAVHYAYDAYGRRSQMTDGTGGQTYAYDDDDALTQKSVTWTGSSSQQAISYTFNPDGSRKTMFPPASRAWSYTYDGVGRLKTVASYSSGTTSYGYLANGWMQTKTLSNGVVTTFTRDAQGRITDLLNSFNGSTLSDFQVPATGGYDGVGNRLSVTASVPGAPASYSGTTSYAYDYGQSANPLLNRSQVTQETSTRASGTFSYGYDGGTSGGPGNPTSFKGITSAFNADNQVTSTGYGYDGNGSPTTYKGQALTFDPEQRLASYGGTTQTDAYDGDGFRAWKQTSAGKTYFLYDGSEPVMEETSTNTIIATNTFGADGLVSRHTSSGSVFYTFDERGNVAQRLSSTGSVSGSEMYDAYGTRTGTGAQPDPFGYGAQAGYYTDLFGTGLVLCTHRYYDPATGRWLTRDPMGYDGGINLYGYCNNDPVNEDDTDGYVPGRAGGKPPVKPIKPTAPKPPIHGDDGIGGYCYNPLGPDPLGPKRPDVPRPGIWRVVKTTTSGPFTTCYYENNGAKGISIVETGNPCPPAPELMIDWE